MVLIGVTMVTKFIAYFTIIYYEFTIVLKVILYFTTVSYDNWIFQKYILGRYLLCVN